VVYSIDEIVDILSAYSQRATYGAVAAVVGRSPRGLMQGRTRSARDSWIVNSSTGLPTNYPPDLVDPRITERKAILSSAEELGSWLSNPV
jgi:hypothetical protein